VTDPDARSSTGSVGGGQKDGGAGLGAHLNELLGLVIAYAKQETVVPLKNLGRFVAWGVAGALLLATGGAFLTLTAVRVVQSETGHHLRGDLTWVPYMGGALVAGAGAAWAATRIVRGSR
jgi:hypothetical protein